MSSNHNDTDYNYPEITWINPVVFLIIALFAVLVTLFILICFFYCIYTLRNIIIRTILKRRLLRKMEIYRGKEGSCIICYNDFLNTSVVKLNCGHIFHKDCILDWFEHKRNCPVCRYWV